MNIAICIKQVPDSARIRFHSVTNTIMRPERIKGGLVQ
jgi:electron transfer flavoprotein alpha/beta subunit